MEKRLEIALTVDTEQTEAEKLKIGQTITWKVPGIDLKSKSLLTKMMKRKLTVTGKTRHLILAQDADGRTYTIQKKEWILENVKKRRKK